MKTSTEHYLKRKNRYDRLLEKYERRINRTGNMRLVVFLLAVLTGAVSYMTGLYYAGGAVLIALISFFVVLMVRHEKLLQYRKYLAALRDVNGKSLQRLSGEWKAFADDGEEFVDRDQNYSYDLDLFGKKSLFQWMNTAKTYTGRNILKKMLLQPDKHVEHIYEKQAAVAELADKRYWRQRFEAEAQFVSDTIQDPGYLIDWAGQWDPFFRKRWVSFGVRFLPVVTVILILLAYGAAVIPKYLPIAALAVQFLLLQPGKKKRSEILDAAYRYQRDINVYSKMLERFETEKFESGYIVRIQNRLKDQKQMKAYGQVEQLVKIVERISNRANQLYFVINILMLRDYQHLIALEQWREQSGQLLARWIQAVGEMEALSSLAGIRYDHPDWVFPEFQQETVAPLLAADEIGHPLLGDSHVCNNIKISRPTNTLLITGSNMSGKSTLLRTVGINLVLAYAGAPVCAKSFGSSVMEIYTCMRVSDDLDEHISSFYAELLRIKKIVEAVNRGEKVFFLLDEIFKGTNSRDRHTGAKILINKLSRSGALGFVSTHDLELGALEDESRGRIRNYHFREYYENNEIHFDYKLRPGISTTQNALYLMRMAGIDEK